MRRRAGPRDPGEGGEPGEAGEAESVDRLPGEAGRGRAQHDAAEAVRDRLRQQLLCDRAAHRVADGDEAVDPLDVGERDHVVGAVRQPERWRAPDPRAMAAMVEREERKCSAKARSTGRS